MYLARKVSLYKSRPKNSRLTQTLSVQLLENANFSQLETPKIEAVITKLLKLGKTKKIHEVGCLSNTPLAAKYHQENVTDNKDFSGAFA